MVGPLTLIFFLALAGVMIALALGLFNMTSNSDKQVSRSNILMRWRVGLQALAVAAIVGIGWYYGAFG
ncbi:MAG: twin transmembrane helix small protein [Pseudomonadota bacterium]